MAASGTGAPAPPPQSVESANLASLLRTSASLTRVWALLGALVALLYLVEIVLALQRLRFAGGGVGGLAYAAIWVAIDVLLLAQLPRWTGDVTMGRYARLKEPLLLWGILALIFGIVPGILVLLAYLKVLPWTDAPAAASPEVVPPPGAVAGPPPRPAEAASADPAPWRE